MGFCFVPLTSRVALINNCQNQAKNTEKHNIHKHVLFSKTSREVVHIFVPREERTGKINGNGQKKQNTYRKSYLVSDGWRINLAL